MASAVAAVRPRRTRLAILLVFPAFPPKVVSPAAWVAAVGFPVCRTIAWLPVRVGEARSRPLKLSSYPSERSRGWRQRLLPSLGERDLLGIPRRTAL